MKDILLVSFATVSLFLSAGCRAPAPATAPIATVAPATAPAVSPSSELALAELKKRQGQVEFFAACPEMFDVSDTTRRSALAALREAKDDIVKKRYAAAWRKLSSAACQTFVDLSVVDRGDVRYANNDFAEFGVFYRGKPCLTGMGLVVTACRADGVAYYASTRSPGWAPEPLGETLTPDRAVFAWGPYLRYKSFPFSLETEVDAAGVYWRFRCSSTPNVSRRPGYPNWFSLTLRGVSEKFWDCPISVIDLQGKRTESVVPALTASAPWRGRFEKISTIVFHRPDGDVELSVKPETDRAPGFAGLTVSADKAKKQWEFRVDWEIPEHASPSEYRADFDLRSRFSTPEKKGRST